MSKPRNDRDLVRIALIGIAAMLVAVVVAVNFQSLPLVGGGTTYRAEFTDASGLVPGEEVRIAGIKVGTITGIALGHPRVVVSFTVKGVDLGDATTAGIEVKTLLGQHYLSVTPDGSGVLAADAVIPLTRTSTPVNIVPAFQQLATEAQGIDTKQAAAAFDALSATLRRTAPGMSQTLRGLSRISDSVTVRDAAIRELFARTSQVSGVVAARDADIGRLLTDTGTVLAELDRRRATITGIIQGTQQLAEQLSGLVADNQNQLGPVLTKLNGVLAVLQNNKANLDQTVRTAALYGREFANVGGSGRFFDSSIKIPQGGALCSTGSNVPGLDGVLNPLLSAINLSATGNSSPCLPLGPAAGSTP